MEISDNMVYIVLVLAVIIIIILIPRDALPQVAEKVKGQFLIVPTGLGAPNVIGSANPSPIETNGKITGYDITIETKLAYINPEVIKDDMLESGNLNVVPVISFKGGRAKGEAFTLNKDKMARNEEGHDWRFNFTVATNEPPVKKYDSGDARISRSGDAVEGVVKEREAFILISPEGGTFLVKLEEYQQNLDWNSSESGLPSYKCDAAFGIRCMNETMPLRVQETTDCIGTKCSDNRAICNGVVEVEMDKPDCERRENRMKISVKGGLERGFGEEISISFWRKSECIEGETDYRNMVANCNLERLSGLYVYEIPLIIQP